MDTPTAPLLPLSPKLFTSSLSLLPGRLLQPPHVGSGWLCTSAGLAGLGAVHAPTEVGQPHVPMSPYPDPLWSLHGAGGKQVRLHSPRLGMGIASLPQFSDGLSFVLHLGISTRIEVFKIDSLLKGSYSPTSTGKSTAGNKQRCNHGLLFSLGSLCPHSSPFF